MDRFRLTLILTSFLSTLATAQYAYKVTTLAGDTAGYRDGSNSVALFAFPEGIAADTTGNLYIADTYNNVIRKEWHSVGLVGTLAGNDTAGFRDGTGAQAEFNSPAGICADRQGNVYVADMYNNRIRKISPGGVVSTLAGNGTAGFKNGTADSAEFYLPTGVAVDTLGNVYVADDGNNSIREISASGTVTTVAGTGYAGFNNGAGSTAQFNGLFGIIVNDSGTIYISEYINNDIRVIRSGVVSVVAGFASSPTPPGIKDTRADSALFYSPMGMVIDSVGDLMICDEYNYRVREIKHDTVSTFAGTGQQGLLDTIVSLAEFNLPYSIARYKATFYVTDNANNRIRAIVPPPPLGIASVVDKEGGLSVYPNPCNDRLMVASAPEGTAQLFDVTGREVFNTPHIKAPAVISTGGLSPGIYFLKVTGERSSATSKIVIQR